MKISVNLFLALLVVTALTGCGIKPANVSAPQGEDKDTFPKVYPDPATFQRPETK